LSQKIINIVDNGALSLLVKADQLDLLFAGDRKVVITATVLAEATDDPTRPNVIKLQEWYDRNLASGNIISGVETLKPADHVTYNPNGKTGQNGDISIMKYLDYNSNDNVIYNIVSNDNDLLDFRGIITKNGQHTGHIYKGTFYTNSPYELIAELTLDKKIDSSTYIRCLVPEISGMG